MKDYSRKNYTDNQFRDWMRQLPAKSIWNQVLEDYSGHAEYSRQAKSSLDAAIQAFIKQSEFKKPYDNKGYKQMEDDASYPPGITPGTDRPFNLANPIDLTGTPIKVIFNAEVDGFWCNGETIPVVIYGTEAITALWVFTPTTGVSLTNIEGYNTRTVSFDLTTTGIAGIIIIEAIMVSDEVITTGPTTLDTDGSGHLIGSSNVSIFEGNCCIYVTPPTWYSGNPTVIAQDSQESVSVTDGQGPFTWAVTGSGYSMTSEETETGVNTLNSTASACGAANITVTDDCGNEVGGVLLGTVGTWRTCGAATNTRANIACNDGQAGQFNGWEYDGDHRCEVNICCDATGIHPFGDAWTYNCNNETYGDGFIKTIIADNYAHGLNIDDCTEPNRGFRLGRYWLVQIWRC